MQGAPSREQFLAQGIWAGERTFIWRRSADFWLTVLWGKPSEHDLATMVGVHEMAFGPAAVPFVTLVDFRRVEFADPAAFAVMVDFASRCRGELERNVVKQALVKPRAPLLGSLVAGFFETLNVRVPVQTHDDAATALEWLRPGQGIAIAAELEAKVAPLCAAPDVVRRLRSLFTRELGRLDLNRAARALNVSTRTLQRQLEEAGTSFRDFGLAVRQERAERLLAGTDQKITAIAKQLGFESLQSFTASFREASGETPAEYRARRRS